MNLSTVIRTAGAVVAVASVGVAALDYRKVVRTERAKREQIAIETEKQIAAIKRAGAIVEQNIWRGDYDHAIHDGTIISAILTDQKFYTMMNRLED